MILLIDMDDVLADFVGRVHELWAERYPDKLQVAIEDRKEFKFYQEPPLKDYKDEIKGICHEPGFIYSLEPLPGALEAMTEIMHLGIEAFICTSPLSDYRNCVEEKYAWVDHHLGNYWMKRIILTMDKTVVTGDYLIDDNPEIKGVAVPSWEQIVFDQPYNRQITDKRRMTWANWREVLKV